MRKAVRSLKSTFKTTGVINKVVLLYHRKNMLAFVGFILMSTSLHSQDLNGYVWHTISETNTQFEGQGWENIALNRLPEKAEKTVRKPVWSLSRHSAGLGLRFETDSDSVVVEYQVSGNLAMPHMPTTGVSGVDLYVKNERDWLWVRGRYTFNDTIRYVFSLKGLPKDKKELHLLFPLYNTIRNLRVGTKINSSFALLPVRKEKPVVVYGTSIAQGACASRPGMAWTSILERKLGHPVINLGFSGNGRLEPEVIDLVNEIDASVFVLDCLPNLSPNKDHTEKEIKKRLHESVATLKRKHPKAAILLVQHAGYSDGLVDNSRKAVYETLNKWLVEVFMELKAKDTPYLHMLSKEDIALSNDAFVDGTHPTDLGMVRYAEAYEKILRHILNMNTTN